VEEVKEEGELQKPWHHVGFAHADKGAQLVGWPNSG
jgi:hypothetical protein